ncbi:MAG: ycdJ [Gemmatimonadetes bacterium]|nr:ycdJ [Gemmatimonadota bacterium]
MSSRNLVARVWRGATRVEDADRYLAYLRETGLADYAGTVGHRSTTTLRRIRDGRAEFVLVSVWDSMDAVRAFAGEDPERAVFYPEDDRFLVERDEGVTHFEVVDRQPETS